MFDGNGTAGSRNLWATATVPSFDISELEGFAFGVRNAITTLDNELSFAIAVDGAWYRTTTVHRNAAEATWQTFSFTDPGTLQWYPVAFTAGTQLNGLPSTATSLPASGAVTGIGLYGYQRGNIRFDEVSVTYVPEPSAALLGLAGLAALGRRRRG